MSETDLENYIIQDTDIFSLCTGEKNKYFQNSEAIDRLKAECDLLAKGTAVGTVISSFSALLALVPVPISLVGLGGMTLTAEYLTRVHRLYLVAKMLLEHFGEDGIKITPRVRTNSAIIDLLITMPDKRRFAFMVRGRENMSVRWREERQEFFATKKGQTIKKYNHLTKTIDELNSLADLRKEKNPLMGITSNERNAPTIKAIVLAKGAEIAASNSPELWTDFGQTKALKIRTASVTYVVKYEELIKFMLLPEKS
jgi:hypothetical protein